MRTSQKTNAAVKPKHPPKTKLENKQVAAASIKTPLERSSSKLVRLYSWAIFISFNVPLSSLWAAHLLSTPPFDPLKYAYTNYFRVCWGLLLYNTAVRVAVISLNLMQLLCVYTLCPLLQLHVTQSLITMSMKGRHYIRPVCVCIYMCRKREKKKQKQDYGRCGWLAVLIVTGHSWGVWTSVYSFHIAGLPPSGSVCFGLFFEKSDGAFPYLKLIVVCSVCCNAIPAWNETGGKSRGRSKSHPCSGVKKNTPRLLEILLDLWSHL